jgi:hypothetical protein
MDCFANLSRLSWMQVETLMGCLQHFQTEAERVTFKSVEEICFIYRRSTHAYYQLHPDFTL